MRTFAARALRLAVPRVSCARPMTAVPSTGLAHYSTQQPTIDKFDLHVPTAMDKQEPPPPGDDFRVVIVGACVHADQWQHQRESQD